MEKICVIGHFAFGKKVYDGQSIKTRNFVSALIDAKGAESILCIDTYGGIKRIHIILMKTINAAFRCNNIVMLPAQNGLKFLGPFLFILNKIFGCKTHYVVIGGWLADYLKSNKLVDYCIKKFFQVYVETTNLKYRLESRGFNNVSILPNFKALKILNKEDMNFERKKQYRLCIFSRIIEKKGIEVAVDVVKRINEKLNTDFFILDIYGHVDLDYQYRFDKLKNTFPKCIQYCGSVDSDKSTDVLKNYDLLLFPTLFFTEGIPGTIIDAYSAGVPVLASKWENWQDVIVNGETGLVYDFGNDVQFEEKLIQVFLKNENISKWKTWKCNCLDKCREYTPENAIRIFLDKI